MIALQYYTADEAMPGIADTLTTTGNRSSPRGLETVEITDALIQLAAPEHGVCSLASRRLNYSLYAYEFLTYVLGVNDRKHAELMGLIAPNYVRFMDKYTGLLLGFYGPHIRAALPHVVELLKRDPDTRQALIPLFDGNDVRRAATPDYETESLDIPCTVSLQFRVRHGAVDLTTTMRSNDLFWGLPYDMASFTTLQRLVAHLVGRPVGHYTHFANSLHYYTEFEKEMHEGYGTYRSAVDRERKTLTPITFEDCRTLDDVLAECYSIYCDLEEYWDRKKSSVKDGRAYAGSVAMTYDDIGAKFAASMWAGLTGKMAVKE